MAVSKLDSLLSNGAVLRYKPGFGFYAVQRGTQHSVDQAEAETGVRKGRFRPEGQGPDKFGVYHFARAAR